MTEHWQCSESINAHQIDGYNLITAYCRPKRNAHGGVVLYALKKWIPVIRHDINEISEPYIFECVAAEFKICDKIYLISVIYKPPNTNIEVFTKKMDQLLDLATKCDSKKLIILGDFNIDILSSAKCPRSKNTFLNLLTAYNMHPTIQTPTRVANKTKTCIDNIIIDKLESYEVRVLNSLISDHYAQILTLDIQVTNKPKIYQWRRCVNNKNNLSKFLDLLKNESWQNVYNAQTVDNKYNNFDNIISCHFNNSFPLKKIKIRQTQQRKVISKEIDTAKETLKFLSELCPIEPLAKPIYKEHKDYYTKLLIEEKKKYNDELIITSENKSKTMWQIINSKNNKSNSNKNIDELHLENGKIITSPEEMSLNLNEYFVTIAKKLISELKSSHQKGYPSTYINKTMYVYPTTANEVKEVIFSLKNKQSTGEDNISNKLLKKICHFILDPLTHVINDSLINGVFPKKLKMAVVIPVYKKGDPCSMVNYRPISLLSTFAKVFEIIMCRRLSNFLTKNNILTDTQHGFRTGRSTTTAIFSFISHLLQAVDEGNIALGIFLDLSKAFDCVNHTILLSKLENYGIRGTAYNWFQSYLLHREQKVTILKQGIKYKSPSKPITVGVPQGSILGPLLFILYINELPNVVGCESLSLTNYADDTNILITGKNFEDVARVNDINFTKICNWFQDNSLILNISKTNCLTFRHSRNSYNYPTTLKLNKENIEMASSTKFLGIIIDEHLNWQSHIQELGIKLSKSCYALKELKKIVSQDTLLAAYYGNFYSIMKYGIIFWGGSQILSIFVLQKRAIRVIADRTFGQSCKGIFKQLNLLTLSCVYIYECLCFVQNNQSLFSRALNDHSYNTRQRTNFTIPLHNSSLLEKGCYYQCIKFYRMLPEEIRTISNIVKFKKVIRERLISAELYDTKELTPSVFSNN